MSSLQTSKIIIKNFGRTRVEWLQGKSIRIETEKSALQSGGHFKGLFSTIRQVIGIIGKTLFKCH